MGNTLSYRKDFGLIVVGAILFTASLLWKDLIIDIEELYFPKVNGICYRFIFTVVITIILVMIAVYLKGLFKINNHKKTKKPDEIKNDMDETKDEMDIINTIIHKYD